MNKIAVTIDSDAFEIGALYRQARKSLIESARSLIEAGHRLTAKKDSLPHGAWLPWLKANAHTLGFKSNETARLLMRAAVKFQVDLEFDEAEALEILREVWGNTTVRGTQGTGDNEWFTPSEYIERARRALGAIDLDPASHQLAQKRVNAGTFFTRKDDGLKQEWHGRVWLNPPYTQPDIELFVDKLLEEVAASRTTAAIMLTHNYTDTAWFQKAALQATLVCFTRGRIAFESPDGEKAAPTQGQAFFYFGEIVKDFERGFADVGFIR